MRVSATNATAIAMTVSRAMSALTRVAALSAAVGMMVDA